jgi:hypothetical protein
MSDDKKQVSPVALISLVNQFFEEREASDECPICSTHGWAIIDGEDVITRLPVFEGATAKEVRGPRLYSLACRNCGYVRTHLRSVVDRTIDLRLAEYDAEDTEGAKGE